MRLGIADTAFTSFFKEVEIAHSIGPSAEPTTSAANMNSVARFRTLRVSARMSIPSLSRHAAGETHVEHAQRDVRQQNREGIDRSRSDVDRLDGSPEDVEAQRGGSSQGSASREHDQQGNERQVKDAERKGGASERGNQMRPRDVAKLGTPTAAVDRDRFVKLPRDRLDRGRDDQHQVRERP